MLSMDGCQLVKRFGMEDLETFLIIGSIESFDKSIFIGAVGWTHIGLDTETEEKPDEWGRKAAESAFHQ
jgi:hypothetical protein